MSKTSAKEVVSGTSAASLLAAKTLAEDVELRSEIPVRASFVRSEAGSELPPPLARLVSTRGRGGAVPLKLYVALIWRCSAPPFSTDILARKWAELLDLPEPNTLGARRVTSALKVLEDEGLVALERRRGESTVVTVLNESGSGEAYSLPSTASVRAKGGDAKRRERYFKVPTQLWVRGYAQAMSAPAFAMLLLLLADRNLDNKPTWWSVERFSGFGISANVRTSGTRDLEELGLVDVGKSLVGPRRSGESFQREKVRNNYRLLGSARPAAMIATANAARSAKGKKKIVVRRRTSTASKT